MLGNKEWPPSAEKLPEKVEHAAVAAVEDWQQVLCLHRLAAVGEILDCGQGLDRPVGMGQLADGD